MRSPITFKDWLLIMMIVLLAGALFILLDQNPFTSTIIDKIRECNENKIEIISQLSLYISKKSLRILEFMC